MFIILSHPVYNIAIDPGFNRYSNLVANVTLQYNATIKC